MSREPKISQIIRQRKPYVCKVGEAMKTLEAKHRQLQEVQSLTERMTQKINARSGETSPNFNAFAHKLSELTERIKAEKTNIEDKKIIEQLQELYDRLNRSTLNIGVTGIPRQGKSTVLQSLTGLTSQEIPSSSGLVCTAVRSTIYHLTGTEETTYAEITFHSEQSFLEEVVTPYFIELGLGTPPTSLDEFNRMEVRLPQGSDTTRREIYDYLLKNHKAQIADYGFLLGCDTQTITAEEIPQYVVKNSQIGEKFYKHLAVKEAKIYCHFPLDDVGKLALIDMPGIGEIKLGNEETLMTMLGRDADIIIFIKRPDALGSDWLTWDTNLYELAAKSSPNLALGKWSFLVLNKNLENEFNVDNLLRNQPQSMTYIDTIAANCKNPKEANQKILEPILDYLIANIGRLDREYAQSCQSRITEIIDEIDRALEEGKSLPNLEYNLNLTANFESLFKAWKADIGVGLDQVQKATAETDFVTKIREVIAETITNCPQKVILPTEEEIYRSCVSLGSGFDSYRITYLKLLTELRVSLSKEFLLLNQKIREIAQQIKMELVKVLREQGNLKFLSSKTDLEFLDFMADFLQQRGSQSLLFGFEFLTEFELSYEAQLLRIIREILEERVDADTQNIGNVNTFLNESAVYNKLIENRYTAINEIQSNLNKWSQTIAKDIYYMVSQFRDMLLYFNEADKEWRIVLNQQDVRSKIWKKLGELEEWQNDAKKWELKLEEAKIGTISLMI